MNRTLVFALMLGAAFTSFPTTAQYPTKPINLIVFTPAGGPSDTAARNVTQKIAKSIGQQVLIDNRPGADGAIAARAVLSAPPDGYTLLWGSGSMVGIPMVQKSAPFQSLAEFAPVGIVTRFAFGMYVHPSVPATSVGEFITYARAHSGKLNYASGTLSEFMAAAHFLRASGLEMLRVPYKGGAQAMPDVLAGRVQLYFTPLSIGHAHAQAGRLRMLATLMPERSPLMPNVPTLDEAGVKGVVLPSWNAIFAPPKTPHEITDRLYREVRLALQDPEVRAAYEQRGVQAVGSSPDELAATIAQDEDLWRRFIRENNIPQQ